MQTSGQLVTSDTIKSQLSWRLPKPVLPADPMLTAPILPMLVRLSLPNMMAMLAMAVVTIAETAYVGALGTPPLAGLALVFPLVMLQQMLSGGAMGGGVSSAISRALGAGDEQRASALAFHAFVLGRVLGLASSRCCCSENLSIVCSAGATPPSPRGSLTPIPHFSAPSVSG